MLNQQVKKKLLGQLTMMRIIVNDMSLLYELYPELNEEVDIQSIIPMSLDEWGTEISGKIEQIAATI